MPKQPAQGHRHCDDLPPISFPLSRDLTRNPMKRQHKPFRYVLAGLALGLAAPFAQAFDWQPTQLQFYFLPEYCQAKMADFGSNRAGRWRERFPINERLIKSWKERIGYDFVHMHHYCAGLGYLATTPPTYHRAVPEINYTRSKSRPGSPLWADMSINYARAVEGLGRRGEAIEILTDLQGQEPTNVDVYVALGATLKRAGKLEDAIAALEEGVTQAGNKRPALFWLAHYYHEAGDINRAAELTRLAEQAGMKMDSLREKLGPAMNRVDATAGN